MRTFPFRLLVVIPALFLAEARADFEKWVNKDGKTAELEFLSLEGEGVSRIVEFRTKTGTKVKMRLADLDETGRARAEAAARVAAADKPVFTLEYARMNEFRGSSSGSGKKQSQAPYYEVQIHFKQTSGAKTWGIQELRIDPIKIGEQVLSQADWRMGPSCDESGQVGFTLSSKKSFEKKEELPNVQVSGSVTVNVVAGEKSKELQVKIPQRLGNKTTEKVENGVEFVVERYREDSIKVEMKGDPNRAKRLSFISNGRDEGAAIALRDTGGHAMVAITYWEKVEPVKVSFSGKLK